MEYHSLSFSSEDALVSSGSYNRFMKHRDRNLEINLTEGQKSDWFVAVFSHSSGWTVWVGFLGFGLSLCSMMSWFHEASRGSSDSLIRFSTSLLKVNKPPELMELWLRTKDRLETLALHVCGRCHVYFVHGFGREAEMLNYHHGRHSIKNMAVGKSTLKRVKVHSF